MPLSLLVLLVIGGIGGITILLHVLGLSRTRKLIHESDVEKAWLREQPDCPILGIRINSGGNTALIETEAGYGIVRVMGQDTMARLLNVRRLSKTRRGLRLVLADPDAPRLHIALSPSEVAEWADKLGGKDD